MATTYEQCGDDVKAMVAQVMADYHPELSAAGVSVGLLMASAHDKDDELIPAVKLHGYQCAATIKRISLKDRAAGKCDAEMTICAATWKDLADAKKIALIDHELEHLEVKLTKENTVDRDDLGRPKLLMKLHDHQLGIFKGVIERHAKNALDYHIAKDFTSDMGQLLLWAEDKRKVG
jgi:hypothetical protein